MLALSAVVYLCPWSAVHGAGSTGKWTISAETPAVENADPAMKRALQMLRNARHELKSAPSPYGGHRTKAMEFTERAIKEIERGLATAKKDSESEPEKSQEFNIAFTHALLRRRLSTESYADMGGPAAP